MKELTKIKVRLQDVYPTRAQFRSDEQVTITLEVTNEELVEQIVDARCIVMELEQEIRRVEEVALSLPAKDTVMVTLNLGSFDTMFTGYGVEAQLYVRDEVQAVKSTAFDVASDWRIAPRYGFLSDFGQEEMGDTEDVKWLSKLHLNLVQYYDWMYRHDDLVSEDENYTDLMGREVSRSVVKEKIELCHAYGMKAIAYGAVYAASNAFAERHPDWRLYTSAGTPYDFIGIFNIMNISPDSPWTSHIVNEYKRAVSIMGFDGIHMDTYGFPKTGWSQLDGNSKLVRLEEQFPQLIEATREALSEVKDDIGLIFNNVGNWPVDTVARASQDAIYIEVWKPYERYHHLRDIIAWAKHLSDQKPIILAAYLKPFRELGTMGEDGAEHAFRLLNAVVTAHGSYHLLHGENGGVLTEAYYVEHCKLRDEFLDVVRQYADFGVRYGHILYDKRMRDVTMTHAEGDNLEYEFAGFPFSTYGEAGNVWTVIRECEGIQMIHFINLTAATDDYWCEAKPNVVPVEGRKVSVAIDGELHSILLASPDHHESKAQSVAYQLRNTVRGVVVDFVLPTLYCWDTVIIRTN